MRVKRGIKARRRRNDILYLASGFRGRSGNTIKHATQRVEKALCYAYRDRRVRKREFRGLWIARISAAVRMHGLSYSQFMHGLKIANVTLDRKQLSQLGINDMTAFGSIVETAKQALQA